MEGGSAARIVLARYENAFICIQAVAMPPYAHERTPSSVLFRALARMRFSEKRAHVRVCRDTTTLGIRETVRAPAHMVVERGESHLVSGRSAQR